VYDSGVQEYELKSGRLLQTWDALNPGGAANVPLASSEQPASAPTGPGGAWDAYHVNSVQPLPGNQLLVSMRNTWAGYLIDTTTNRVVWTLGGKRSSFSIPSSARFSWQHDVRLLPDGDMTLYDDACCKELPGGRFAHPEGQSRGLVLRPNLTAHTVSLLAAYPHRPPRVSAFLGSMQRLPNGNALVGWGSVPFFSEYSSTGKLLLDAAWPGKDQSYRAISTPSWVGTPYFPPSGALRRARGATTVYASWNGATEVTSWRVLAGTSATHLARVATSSRAGFETSIVVRGAFKTFELQALNAGGQVLGTSAVLH
jgi:hypothetical protein